MLSSLANERVHHPPKAPFPRLLRNASRTYSPDRRNTPTVQYSVTSSRPMEYSSSRCRWADRMSELVHLWASDDDCDVGQEGATRWVYLDPPPLIIRLTILPAESENTDADSDGSKVHRANRAFSRNHAMAIHLNAIAMIATVFYGFSLSATLLAGF
jgi:hypothetical protein